MERNFGFAIAHAYAGHFDEADNKNATLTYVKAAVHDVATALAALTGEPHPLAALLLPTGRRRRKVYDVHLPPDPSADTLSGSP